MSDKITTFIPQPFQVPGSMTATIDDSVGVTIVTFPAAWCIHLLAPSGASGASETTAKGFAAYVTAVLNTGTSGTFSCALTPAGYYAIQCTDTSNWDITWTTSAKIMAELGFSSDLSGAGGGSTVTATFPPAHCIMSHFRPVEADGDYQPKFGFVALSRMQSGIVDVLASGKQIVDRMFGLSDHPRTPADRLVRGTPATPVFPDENDHARWTDPISTMDTTPGLWTIHRSVATGMGLRLAYTLGQFQQLAATPPTITYFNYGYWTEQTLKSKVSVFAPPLISMSKRDGLELTRMATAGAIP